MSYIKTENRQYVIEVVAPTVALVHLTGAVRSMIGCVFIDHTGAWNVRYSAGVDYLPVNDAVDILKAQSHNEDEIGGLTVTLEEVLRKRLNKNGDAGLEIDIWLDDNGALHMSVVGDPAEDWPAFTVAKNRLKKDKDNGKNPDNQ